MKHSNLRTTAERMWPKMIFQDRFDEIGWGEGNCKGHIKVTHWKNRDIVDANDGVDAVYALQEELMEFVREALIEKTMEDPDFAAKFGNLTI